MNNITNPFNHYDGNIGIEIRGHSSQDFPKKQFGIETRYLSFFFGLVSILSFFNIIYSYYLNLKTITLIIKLY